MKKLLPIYDNPITTYPHTANLAAILWGDEKVYPWLMNCFIKLHSWDTIENMDYEDFWILDCPIIHCDRIHKDLIKKGWGDMLSFIKDAINLDFYIYLIVKTDCIQAYGSSGYPHDMLIYGYDDELKIFHIADFFQGNGYSFETASYQELENSLIYETKQYTHHWIFDNDIMLLKAKHNQWTKFDPERVKTSIYEYLNGVPTHNWDSRLKLTHPSDINKYIFGKDCYKVIYHHLIHSMEYNETLEHWRQVFHMMHEHKAVMCERIQYMGLLQCLRNSDNYFDSFKELSTKTLVCKNMYIKYICSHNKNLLTKIWDMMKSIEKMESDILSQMAEDIIL